MMIVRKSVGLIKKLERFISIVGRHLYEKNVNLNHTEVENAIANELYGKNLEINKHYKNTIEVNGITIEYNAFKRENGVINIGTYYVPETK